MPESEPLQSFSPVIRHDSHTLILGSMPGKRSLSEARYYAHPRNAFWPIMGELFGAHPELPYQQRLAILLQNGIAIWDVIGQCTRTTSLDSDIIEESITVNDLPTLLHTHPGISRIFFNGGKSEQSFKRYVLPTLEQTSVQVQMIKLTSTSPANARCSLQDKVDIWRRNLLPAHA